MGKKKNDLFWVGYGDLMTSLFFVILVLFAVSIVILNSTTDQSSTQISILEGRIDSLTTANKDLKKKIKEYEIKFDNLKDTIAGFKVREKDYQRLLNLDVTFKSLSQSSSLRYDENHRTFIAKDFEGIEIFEPGKASIKKEYLNTVDKVGKDLQWLLEDLYNEGNGLVSYLLVIEGNTANTWDYGYDVDNENSYIFSFRRALALYKRWLSIGIDLRKYNTEIQLCGSGMNGINRDDLHEENNKRFIIQIIPKISRSE